MYFLVFAYTLKYKNAKNYFEFKGYNGSVEFSEEDKVFFGKIQGINDVVTFEGVSIIELQEAFQESVLDYLEVLN